MSYDKTKDPFGPSPLDQGSQGLCTLSQAITPNDTIDLAPYVRIVGVVAGNVAILPARNADNDSFVVPIAVGQVLPWLVRRVLATGTSATVRTAEKFI
jgi:hypothetical protein